MKPKTRFDKMCKCCHNWYTPALSLSQRNLVDEDNTKVLHYEGQTVFESVIDLDNFNVSLKSRCYTPTVMLPCGEYRTVEKYLFPIPSKSLSFHGINLFIKNEKKIIKLIKPRLKKFAFIRKISERKLIVFNPNKKSKKTYIILDSEFIIDGIKFSDIPNKKVTI
jgi:hypothetical protein